MNDAASRRFRSVGGTLVLLALIIAVGATVATILIARPHGAGQLRLADRGSGGLRVTLPEDPEGPAVPGATKSSTPTASAEATASTATTAAASRVASATSPAYDSASVWSGDPGSTITDGEDRSGSSGGPSGSGSDASTLEPGSSDPDAPGLPGSEDPRAAVSGRVTHAVWGTPLVGVPVRLDPAGLTTVTGNDGRFAFEPVPASALLLVAIDGGGWRSDAGTMRSLTVPDGGSARADFALYGASEAFGTDWRSAAEWSASGADLDRLLPKVRGASAEFAATTEAGARSVLAGVRGSTRERARAELLATWLDLASARLGFDAAVDPSRVAGASRHYGGASTALELVRQADRAVSSGDADWSATRRVLTGEVLAFAGAADSLVQPEPDTGPKQKKRPGLD